MHRVYSNSRNSSLGELQLFLATSWEGPR
jgi:hypothetical protein